MADIDAFQVMGIVLTGFENDCMSMGIMQKGLRATDIEEMVY